MDKISRNYKIAVYSFIVPFAFLGLYLLDSWTFGFTQMLFFATFIISLMPAGCIGLVYTLLGLRISFKENNTQKKDIGYANLLMGLIIAGVGFLGLGFAYLMIK